MFHDARYGGWYWSAGPSGPADPRKQTYGHAFVLLAACTAARAGCDTGDLMAAAAEIIESRLLDATPGLCVEGWDREWPHSEDYRGQNPNMHLVEAFMAAAELTGDHGFTSRAITIAERIVGELAAGHGWRVPEHFDSQWRPLPDFNRGPAPRRTPALRLRPWSLV